MSHWPPIFFLTYPCLIISSGAFELLFSNHLLPMSLHRLVTACLCSWARVSGYIEVPIRDVPGGGFDIIFVERYFGAHADIGEHTVIVSDSNAAHNSSEFLVFFDRNTHANGSQRCPYLVLKVFEGSRAENLTRSDYVAVVVAIDESVVLFDSI